MFPAVLTQVATGLSVLAGAVLVKSVMDQKPMAGPFPRCPTCNGTGRIACICSRWSDGDVGCRTCAGSGRMACSSCGGVRYWSTPPGPDFRSSTDEPWLLSYRPHECSNLVLHILDLCVRRWEVTFSHVAHSSNKIADYLVKMGFGGEFDVQILNIPPVSVAQNFQDEVLMPPSLSHIDEGHTFVLDFC
ncbi:hypothetical protein V6N13_005287 [Hibiscus sabdariffa]